VRSVFADVTADGFRSAIRDACVAAKRDPTQLMPHKWRHRRISLWLAQGLSPAELTARTGHSDEDTTLSECLLARHRAREATQSAVEGALRGRPVVAPSG